MPWVDHEPEGADPGEGSDGNEGGGFEGHEHPDHSDNSDTGSEAQNEADPIDSGEGSEHRATGLDDGDLSDNAVGDVCDELSDRYDGFDSSVEWSLLGERTPVEYHLLDTRLDGSSWDAPEPGERTTSWLDLDLDLSSNKPERGFDLGYVVDKAMAFTDFLGNYVEMRIANTKGADKFFHCMANCEASSRGPGGQDAAQMISDERERSDFGRNVNKLGFAEALRDCRADNVANRVGRDAGRSGERCYDACERFRPRGLD